MPIEKKAIILFTLLYILTFLFLIQISPAQRYCDDQGSEGSCATANCTDAQVAACNPDVCWCQWPDGTGPCQTACTAAAPEFPFYYFIPLVLLCVIIPLVVIKRKRKK